MDLKPYQYITSDNHLIYKFDSIGPNGIFRKIVRYRPVNTNGITYFNLGFGDINPLTGKIDDLAVTNNLDREKILTTVAATVLDFTNHFPDALVYAEGSTPARTRLYQMGIAANWEEINLLLYVYGLEGNKGWQPFCRKVNYRAFLATRK